MKYFKYIFGLMAWILIYGSSWAQFPIDFESDNGGYSALKVYDSWEDSPFRTGKLKGNVKVITNHLQNSDSLLGIVNPSEHILAFQRSRWGSNLFGARVDLTRLFRLSPVIQYVHVTIYKSKAGRVMLTGLGKLIKTDFIKA